MRGTTRAFLRCPECDAEFAMPPGRARLAPHPERGASGLPCPGAGHAGDWVVPWFAEDEPVHSKAG